jgi:hypothetical protein
MSQKLKTAATFNQAIACAAVHAPGTTYPINQETLATAELVLYLAALFERKPMDVAKFVMWHRQFTLKMPVGCYSCTLSD